ncbi:acyltransferase family protein [Mycobacterium fragae]|uniref:Glycerol acyltransferase n=1 Tax=Mycobacterium fragae TaxID=1260918 RepID=A0A1X1UPG6_9MYCO|nr:lysophospholipid acyltransferase family protein [Mycobacterium fragae]MCV7399939.1 acyltransferase family protein [Mycobacterium fragae]ORV58722.1 glycerol acyltransferase [Mycobacterium fragae]
MSELDVETELAKWDPQFTKRVADVLRPLVRRYFRTEVRGLENIPPAGGALLVSNHSGGQFAADVPILAVEFYEKFGYDRPIHTLSHDMLFVGPIGSVLLKTGFIRANPENAANALRSGHLVVVFPGGDYDAMRPTAQQNTIDFAERKGYVRTAIEAGVPIVPAVSIGGQENQLYLMRGTGLAKRLGPIARAARTKIVPLSFGLPFGLSLFGTFPPNLPLPTKIVTQVLEPIDIAAEFGEKPDIDEVDAHVREVMQSALDKLAGERRFPIVG